MAITTYKLANGKTYYRAEATINGKRATKRGFTTKRDAKRWIAKLQTEGKNIKPIAFDTLAYEWLEQYRPTVKPSTYAKTKTIIYHAIDHFGNTPVAAITNADAQALANKWSYEYTNYKKMVTYISTILKYAIANERLDKNPFDNIRMPLQHKEPKEIELWTTQELQRFLEACKRDPRKAIYPFFRLIAYTGMRRQEALALTWDDIDQDNNTIRIEQAITVDYDGREMIGDTKNKTSTRELAIDTDTMNALAEWKQYATSPHLVFPYNLNTPGRWMRQIIRDNNLPPSSPHKLRHLHCTILIEAGANIKDVQERLGHSDIETTLSIYAHANRNKSKAADIFAQAIQQQTTPQTTPNSE